MKISELVELLKAEMDENGDSEVFLEVEYLDYFSPVYEVTGKWSTYDRSRYDGSPVRCFIHGKYEKDVL